MPDRVLLRCIHNQDQSHIFLTGSPQTRLIKILRNSILTQNPFRVYPHLSGHAPHHCVLTNQLFLIQGVRFCWLFLVLDRRPGHVRERGPTADTEPGCRRVDHQALLALDWCQEVRSCLLGLSDPHTCPGPRHRYPGSIAPRKSPTPGW